MFGNVLSELNLQLVQIISVDSGVRSPPHFPENGEHLAVGFFEFGSQPDPVVAEDVSVSDGLYECTCPEVTAARFPRAAVCAPGGDRADAFRYLF